MHEKHESQECLELASRCLGEKSWNRQALYKDAVRWIAISGARIGWILRQSALTLGLDEVLVMRAKQPGNCARFPYVRPSNDAHPGTIPPPGNAVVMMALVSTSARARQRAGPTKVESRH